MPLAGPAAACPAAALFRWVAATGVRQQLASSCCSPVQVLSKLHVSSTRSLMQDTLLQGRQQQESLLLLAALDHEDWMLYHAHLICSPTGVVIQEHMPSPAIDMTSVQCSLLCLAGVIERPGWHFLLVYGAWQQAQPGLRLLHSHDLLFQPRPRTFAPRELEFSPDCQFMAFVDCSVPQADGCPASYVSLVILEVRTGKRAAIRVAGGVRCLQWASDSGSIALVYHAGYHGVQRDVHNPQLLLRGGEGRDGCGSD